MLSGVCYMFGAQLMQTWRNRFPILLHVQFWCWTPVSMLLLPASSCVTRGTQIEFLLWLLMSLALRFLCCRSSIQNSALLFGKSSTWIIMYSCSSIIWKRNRSLGLHIWLVIDIFSSHWCMIIFIYNEESCPHRGMTLRGHRDMTS